MVYSPQTTPLYETWLTNPLLQANIALVVGFTVIALGYFVPTLSHFVDLLHVLGFRRQHKLGYLGKSLRATRGRLRPDDLAVDLATPGPILLTAGKADTAEPFQIDGDDGGDLPIELRLTEDHVRLVVP